MVNKYRRQARTWAELDLGPLTPLNQAIPELGPDRRCGEGAGRPSKPRPRTTKKARPIKRVGRAGHDPATYGLKVLARLRKRLKNRRFVRQVGDGCPIFTRRPSSTRYRRASERRCSDRYLSRDEERARRQPPLPPGRPPRPPRGRIPCGACGPSDFVGPAPYSSPGRGRSPSLVKKSASRGLPGVS